MNIYIKLTSWLALPIGIVTVLQVMGLRWQISVLVGCLIFTECYNFSRLLDMYLNARVAKKRILACELILWTLVLIATVSMSLYLGGSWFVVGLMLSVGLFYQIVIVLPAGIYTLLGHLIHVMDAHLPGEEAFNRALLWVFNRRRTWLLVSVVLTIITIVLPLFIDSPSLLIWKETAYIFGFITALFCLVLPLALAVGPDEQPKLGYWLVNSHYYMSWYCVIVITLYAFM